MSHALQAAKRLIVIPARRKSTRLPDKLLLRETGKTVLQHTFEAAQRSRRAEAVVIAVDDVQLAREARQFGATAVMTDPNCASGTDRVAEVVRELPEVEVVVNVQGDEPEIDPVAVDRLFDALAGRQRASVATLATPIRSVAVLNDPACVKVVFGARGEALYFSRLPIPAVRDIDPADLLNEDSPFFHHLGVYAFRRWPLLRFAEMPRGRLEQLEQLEQLRILEAGETILVCQVDEATAGIDTPADYAAFVERRKAG